MIVWTWVGEQGHDRARIFWKGADLEICRFFEGWERLFKNHKTFN
jgi:hypothetical protein